VQATCDGRALDLTLLAEGVETEEQRVLLRLAGCQEMQGFLFARPGSREGPTVGRGPSPKPVDRRQGGMVFLPPEAEEDLEVNDQPDPTRRDAVARLKARRR
jgi:EAL domain-containing protein (putative c-di-GMP-specific phosphodiesterase class I)